MSDLVEFLRARLDEDEAMVTAATPGPWHVSITRFGCIDAGTYDTVIEPGEVKCWSYCYGGSSTVEMSAEDAAHIARHDPARMLAEVAAKRAIIDLHPDSGWNDACQGCEEQWPCRTLRHLAAVYSGHDDYRKEEWKP